MMIIDPPLGTALREAIAYGVRRNEALGPEEIRRLRAIVKILLDNAPRGHGGQVADGEALQLARRIALRHVVHATDAGVRVAIELDPVVPVRVDQLHRLETLLDTLVRRAVQRRDASQVVIRAVVQSLVGLKPLVTWSVIDDGAIGQDDRSLLEQCRPLSDALGADLQVDDHPRDGSTIAFTLPAAMS